MQKLAVYLPTFPHLRPYLEHFFELVDDPSESDGVALCEVSDSLESHAMLQALRWDCSVLALVRTQQDLEATLEDVTVGDAVLMPCHLQELRVRIDRLFVRPKPVPKEIPLTKSAYISLPKRKVFSDGIDAGFTNAEFNILVTLLKHRGQPVTFNEMLGSYLTEFAGNYHDRQCISVHIASINRKVPDINIVSIRSYGYMLGDSESSEIYDWLGFAIEKTDTVCKKAYRTTFTFQGKTQGLVAWSKEIGISEDPLRARIRLGWDTEKILTTPVREWKQAAVG